MLNQCALEISIEDSEEYPSLVKYIRLQACHPTLNEISSLNAVLIYRDRCRGCFLEVMHGESQELHEVSKTLFDRNGCLRPELVDHEYHKGSGCWRRELDSGTIIYITSIEVLSSFRGQRVGSWVLKQFTDSPYVGENDFVITWPAPLEYTRSKAEWRQGRDTVVRFFRKNGFRRIGRTTFFAYSKDASHPSHAIPVINDSDGYPEFIADDDNDPLPQYAAERYHIQELKDQERLRKFPLHHAVASKDPDGAEAHDIDVAIRVLHNVDRAIVRTQDENGFTPLHIASGFHNYRAVKALLDLPRETGVYEDLVRRDNVQGLTPLETCERDMRSTRDASETLLHRWDGYRDAALKTMLLLKRAVGEPIADTEREYIRQRKWGCTCGRCVDGFISPRMCHRILFETEMIARMMNEDRLNWSPCNVLDHVPSRAISMDFIPPSLHRAVDSTFYSQFRDIIATIGIILSTAPVRAPTPDVIRTCMGPRILFYLLRGGLVEYALDCVTYAARDQSPEEGDGTFDEAVEDIEFQIDPEWAGLPNCANDLNFILVRERLGLGATEKWGPYPTDSELDAFDAN